MRRQLSSSVRRPLSGQETAASDAVERVRRRGTLSWLVSPAVGHSGGAPPHFQQPVLSAFDNGLLSASLVDIQKFLLQVSLY